MKKYNFIYNVKALLMMAVGLFVFNACDNEPDGDDLYTSTGKTINDYIMEDAELSSFEYILQRIGMDKNLSAWGTYTCFAPTNDGVTAYLDSLWNDDECRIPHNGMTENSLEGLTDSLCNDIAKYHLINGTYTIVDLAESSGSINTLLGYMVSTEVQDGYTLMNSSRIISGDNEAVNGIFHKVDDVIARSSRLIGDEMDHVEGYTIFNDALKLTGIDKLMVKAKKDETYTINDNWDVSASSGTKTDELYWPEECRVGFTIFAESDEVLAKHGIHNIDDLIAYANEQYKDCAQWYDYVSEKGITVSTGDDYTNQWNCLNMFVRYHCLYVNMAKDQLVFESGSSIYWNYNNTLCGGEPYDYYETMLPHTLIKIWEPQAYACGTSTNSSSKRLYINRYRPNNTLTDEVGTLGSAAMHGTIRENIRVDTNVNRQAHNGHIHGITDMLVYDWSVKNEVLHERLRFDATTFLPEFINNGFRYNSATEVSAMNGGGSGARIAFPLNYFDNVHCYNDQNKLRYNVKGAFRSLQADAFQGWGNYDLAIKMPPIPTGNYEMRMFYSPMQHGGFMQFYLGTSSDISSMQPLGIPLDVRIAAADERIGWTDTSEEDDRGIETDRALRNKGYMRGPFSYRGHAESYVEAIDGNGNCRTDGTVVLRKILTTQQFRQSEEYWLRIKNMLSNGDALKWQLDFVEFVPVDIVNNDQYQEDWM